MCSFIVLYVYQGSEERVLKLQDLTTMTVGELEAFGRTFFDKNSVSVAELL